MQTFLPDPTSLRETFKILDNRRLGKQRIEAYQILHLLHRPKAPHGQHPAVRMWRGNRKELLAYYLLCLREWESRGFENYMPWLYPPGSVQTPWWLKEDRLWISHRSNLLRKDPEWYGQFGWDVPDNYEYWWPVNKDGSRNESDLTVREEK